MKLKLDDKGNAVLQDGAPVYVKDDGSEIAFDGSKAFAKIGQLTGENTAYKTRFNEAESRLKAFEGIEDAEKAREALKVIANLDAKKLVDAGEIEKVKTEIGGAYQKQLDAAQSKVQALEQQFYSEKVGGAFARSKFILEKLAIPSDMARAFFGGNFSIEEGRVVAKDASGNKLYSGKNPGELAEFDEAMEMLVNAYSNKDAILKGTGASGGGATGNNGSGGGKPKGNLGGTREERLIAIKANMPAGISQ